MFHPSSIHNFDTMFVILCVIAGATSHDVSNSSKTTPHLKSQNRYRSSFIEILLEGSLSEVFRSPGKLSNELNDGSSWQQPHKESAQDLSENRKEPSIICAQLSSILSGSQIKFCQRHNDILVAVLPEVIQLTRKECARITKDLRWNCSVIDSFLDRSNPLSFTKEAALVRSIINASMMYLTAKTCGDNQQHSCGCHSYGDKVANQASSSLNLDMTSLSRGSLEDARSPSTNMSHVALSGSELKKLETGSALRITRSMIRRQACTINIPFAEAFTKIFMDAEDTRALNKAYKILNEKAISGRTDNNIQKNPSDKRLADTDYKDLSFIKWTKSAINLHNNHIGRQAVRGSTRRYCRCHGLSGMCQYQTCWDRLEDIERVTSKLREIFLNHSELVEPRNVGTYNEPDLYLVKAESELKMNNQKFVYATEDTLKRISPGEMAYLYPSPDYCDSHPSGGYSGTAGRQCFSLAFDRLATGVNRSKRTSPQVSKNPAYDSIALDSSSVAQSNVDAAYVSECDTIAGEVMLAYRDPTNIDLNSIY